MYIERKNTYIIYDNYIVAQNTVYTDIQSGSYIVYIYTHTYTCKTNYLYYTQWYEIILLHIYIYMQYYIYYHTSHVY